MQREAEASAVATGSSRERILDAAERLVAERGYTAASISLISKKSGLPASSIYWHFGSKEELLAAVAERGSERWVASRASWASFGGDLFAFLQATGQSVAQHPDFLRLLMMLILDGKDGAPRARQALRAEWSRVEKRLEHILADYFRLGAGPENAALTTRLARFTLAFVDGAFVDSQIDPDGTRIPDLFADLAVALTAIVRAGR